MKQLLALFTLFLATTNLFADCHNSGIYVWPTGETIKQNSVFVVIGYASSQEIIRQINQKNQAYLVSGKEKIKLIAKDFYAGEFRLTQVVLQPEKPLTEGTTVQLVIEESSKEKIHKINHYDKKPIWKVTKDIDTESPVWVDKPIEKNKSIQYFGCGPASYVNFSAKTKDDSEVLIKVSVTAKDSKQTTTYLLMIEKEILSIGHGMCSGAFRLINDAEYQVSFDLMDSSGNETKWPDSKISFKAPKDSDQ